MYPNQLFLNFRIHRKRGVIDISCMLPSIIDGARLGTKLVSGKRCDVPGKTSRGCLLIARKRSSETLEVYIVV